MNTREMLSCAEEGRRATQDNPLFFLLGKMSEMYHDLAPLAIVLPRGDNPNILEKWLREVTAARKVKQEAMLHMLNIREVITASTQFGDDLRRMYERFGKEPGDLYGGIQAGLAEFNMLFDRFIKNRKLDDLVPMMMSADSLYYRIGGFVSTLHWVELQLKPQVVADEDSGEFSVYLQSDVEFATFVDKLGALNELYLELCGLLEVSAAQHPLRIAKIESGSLWSKVFGEPRVLDLMATLIEKTAGWLYRRFTHEGQETALAIEWHALREAIDVREILVEAGMPTDQMDELLAKAGVEIARRLATLISGEPVVEVNGKTIAVDDAMRDLYIEKASTRQIEHNPDNDGE